jgi:hypothetical protein
MALKSCLLAYTKDFSKDSTTAKGDETKVTANAILLIPEDVTDHFNIPTVENVSAQVQQVIKGYTYQRYGDFTDSTGIQVVVPDFERGGGGGTASAKNVVRLPHATLKTSKKKPRTCSIRFPRFFNLIMIGQALGTMLKAHAPDKWMLDRTGKKYPFLASTSTGLMPGYQSGAWVVTTPVAATNDEDTSAVGPTTVVASRSRRKASATVSPP